MKTIVIYTSQTGFTERYARWIAEATGADCLPLKEAEKQDLSAYEAIVYGGWACAGSIRRVDWFKKKLTAWPDKKLAVFCVGGSPADNPDIEIALNRIFSEAERENVATFYFPGGFNYEKMPVASRIMMKMFLKALQAKKDKTEAEKVMAEMIGSSYDISNPASIEPLVQYLKASS